MQASLTHKNKRCTLASRSAWSTSMVEKLTLVPTPDEILIRALREFHRHSTKEGNAAALKVFDALSDEGKMYAFEQLLRVHLRTTRNLQELESYVQVGARLGGSQRET